MKLLVGLGNPGGEYARHRHNIGFMALDRIAARHRLPAWRRRFQGEATEGDIAGARVLLLKPMTYMNESGRAVGEASRFLKIALADIVVLHDELDLDPGRVKVKTGGGNAGHNGLRSISAHIGNEYVRVRLGIGHPGHKDAVARFVLSDFAKADAAWLDPLLDAIADHAAPLAAGDQARFQTDIARTLGAGSPPPEKPVKSAPARPGTGTGENSKPAAGRHPAGERMAKRQGALAENVKKWLSRQRTDDGQK